MKSRGKRENTPLLDYGVTNETGKAQKAEIVALAANPAGKCESRNYRQIPLGAGSLASGMGTRPSKLLSISQLRSDEIGICSCVLISEEIFSSQFSVAQSGATKN